MNQQVATKGIQLVTISRPTAYGEYAPYTFIESEKEFEDLVQKMGSGRGCEKTRLIFFASPFLYLLCIND